MNEKLNRMINLNGEIHGSTEFDVANLAGKSYHNIVHGVWDLHSPPDGTRLNFYKQEQQQKRAIGDV